MRNIIKITLATLIAIASINAVAASQWICKSKDSSRSWTSSPFAKRQQAINQAWRKCRKNSKHMKTCRVAANMCHHNASTKMAKKSKKKYKRKRMKKHHRTMSSQHVHFANSILWRCTAQDNYGLRYPAYGHYEYQSVRNARARCRMHTPQPDRCFITRCKQLPHHVIY